MEEVVKNKTNIFNIVVILICVVVYFANQLILKSSIGGDFVMYHLNDFTAIIALLAFANLSATVMNPFGGRSICTLRHTLIIALFCSLFWELLTPLYKTSTTDWRDIVFYLLGALLYWALRHTKKLYLIMRD